jgi:hypothetical protein
LFPSHDHTRTEGHIAGIHKTLAEHKETHKDHEVRIRSNEKFKNTTFGVMKAFGITTGGGFSLAAVYELLKSKLGG